MLVYFLMYPPSWLREVPSPGVSLLLAVASLAIAVAGAATVDRTKQRGLWGISPFLTALPIGAIAWLNREALSSFATASSESRTAVVAILVLVGIRSLAEFALGFTVVGAFFAPDSSILWWYAVPTLCGLAVVRLILDPILEALEPVCQRAIGNGRTTLARGLAWAAFALAIMQRGTERQAVESFAGTTYALTGDPETAIPWKKRAAAASRRRGLVEQEIGALRDLATNQNACGRQAAAIMSLGRAKHLAQDELLAQYLRQARSDIGESATNTQSESQISAMARSRVDYEIVTIVELEARVHRNAGDVESAFRSLDEALELVEGLRDVGIIRNSGVPEIRTFRHAIDRKLIELLDLKAKLYGSFRHDFEAELDIYTEAESVASSTGNLFANFLIVFNSAIPLVRLERYQEAQVRLERALEIAKSPEMPVFGADAGDEPLLVSPNADLTVMALGGLANVMRLQGRLDSAAELYEEALATRRADADASVGLNSLLGMSLVHLERGERKEAQDAADEAVARAERLGSEASLRPAHMTAGKAYEQEGSPSGLQTAKSHYQRVIALLEQTRSSVREEAGRLQFLGSEARVEVYERMVATCAALGQAGDAFDYAERGKARAMAEKLSGEWSGSPPLSYSDTRELLRKVNQSVLVVHYSVAAEAVVLVGVRAEGEPTVATTRVDRGALRRFVVANFGDSGQVRTFASSGLDEMWHSYDDVIGPIASWARPDDVIVLMPHGLLHYLPIHALRIDGQYLIERNPIAYAPSASVLQECLRTSKDRQSRNGACVLGDPNGDLPYARAEAEAVGQVLGVAPLLGSAVNRQTFLESMSRAVVHYAGHARFDPAEPLKSGLQLVNDDLISAQDIAATPDVACQLITLSGCETGVSAQYPGDELMGLLRGVLYAGAPSVLASLWRVSDESTAHLMLNFYSALAQRPRISRAHALRQAILATRAHPDWASLYHWAPFTLVGDWR
jgi:CHAT domain-containing protein